MPVFSIFGPPILDLQRRFKVNGPVGSTNSLKGDTVGLSSGMRWWELRMIMFNGNLKKMGSRVNDDGQVSYWLKFGEEEVALNPLVGGQVSLKFQGEINCISCGRKVKKSYQQGYCFPCVRSLPETDLCQVRPELCHYKKGTCRDRAWGEKNCLIPHTVYLALSSGLKVGITRSYARLSRWIDQGAVKAVPIAGVRSRKEAGLVETELMKHFSDKTNWRAMLQGNVEDKDLKKERLKALSMLPADIDIVSDPVRTPLEFQYPVLEYPEKVKSLSLDKTPHIEGTLMGIKGQYLIFQHGVLNCRKFAGYKVCLSHTAESRSPSARS